jgi:hypothetical protein
MKKIIIILAVILVLCLVVIVALDLGLGIRFALARKTQAEGIDHYLAWNQDLTLYQKGNTCGAHASMAYLYIKTNGIVDPYSIYNDFENKMPNGYVYPWSITKYLSKNGVKAKIYNFWFMSDNKKIAWINRQIMDGNPVIVIVGSKTYLHYITIVGHDRYGFSIYDSAINGDWNNSKPGNTTVNEIELIADMKNASFNGIRIQLMISK